MERIAAQRIETARGLEAAMRSARLAAFGPGEYVGQESFMRASDILDLATRAGIGPGTSVLDLCCGVAGPGRLIAGRLGCTYLGVDGCPESIDVARGLAGGRCHFEVSRIPPLPAGRFDVVLLLETMLAFPDKQALLRGVSAALVPGGRFAFTVEEGLPLTEAERELMPGSDTVWPVPFADLVRCLAGAGLRVAWRSECTRAHRESVDSLLGAFESGADEIRERVEGRAFDDLLTGHRLWSDWLRRGRVRKFAVVVERTKSR